MLLGVFLLGLGGTGCREVGDALNAGENERAENEANRRRFHQQRTEARQRKMEPVLRKAKAPPKEPVIQFDPESPEGMLLAEIEARLACRDDTCRSEALQRLRRHAKTLLPALPGLMIRQEDKVVVEALRLAGLFKVQSSLDAVARVLMLGDKRVREEAVWSIGAIGDPRGVAPLKRFAVLDNPPRIMAAICRSLGQIGSVTALDPITSVFLKGAVETRVECLDAAARLKGARARSLFERAVKDPRPVVSELAGKYLKALAPEPAKAPEPASD